MLYALIAMEILYIMNIRPIPSKRIVLTVIDEPIDNNVNNLINIGPVNILNAPPTFSYFF